MTITGIILSGDFSGISSAAADAAMLADFAKATLKNAANAQFIYEVKGGSLSEQLSKLNDNGDGYLLLSQDAAFESAPVFCVQKDTKFVTERGEFLGAYIKAACEFESLCKLPAQTVAGSTVITLQNLAAVTKKRRAAINELAAQNGVFIDGGTVSPLSKIGRGSCICGGARIYGESVIGKNCTVSGASELRNAVIGDNTTVVSCVISDSKLGNNVSAGPFSYIRPGSVVGDNVKVGDFVEIKNSAIGDKTKISHLTYVGDSDVGRGVNFGCGTVTVNYDGVRKNRTVIGDNVFIGCNTNLVAPVSVGDNAFIAAGSTITDEIPPKSFAIARQRQTTKENYVEQKMPDMLK